MADAIVIGAGPNGLVAANRLVDAGWSVLVLEAQPEPGGAVRSGALTEPGFVHDRFSAFYPLAAASPAIRELELEQWGLEWRRAPLALAHPALDGSCAVLSRELDETCASLDGFAAGDGDAWRELFGLWRKVRGPLLQALVTPLPPRQPLRELAAALGPAGAARFARLGLLPVRRLAEERFGGAGAARLLAGNALHADFRPESRLSGFYGFLLCALGQDVGCPFPRGGAGELTAALVRRLEARGGQVRCGARVERVLVRDGRAVGVRVAGGEELAARRAVLADVAAPHLYQRLLARGQTPGRVRFGLRWFRWDWATVKVDWALDGPIPWSAPDARRSAVVHVAESLDELSASSSELEHGLVPRDPFLVVGQYAVADGTRAPAGKDTAWAYTHVPQGLETDTAALAERMEARIEALAPGFGALVRARHVAGPRELEEADENLAGGAINGGTARLRQQLLLRPPGGFGRPETGIAGLYLASASAHPGGGVHGGPGAIAAATALRRCGGARPRAASSGGSRA